jgi:glycosyltransferase involved in cell wall biosynthesis
VIKLEKPEIVISFMKQPNTRNIIATLGLKNIKRVISVRVDSKIEYRGKFGYFISRAILPYADGCVFQTSEAKKWFPKSLQKKSRIIVNPVRDDFFSIKRKPVYGKIVTLGRLATQKNHFLLINSFNKIKDEFPKAILEIYGIGDEYQNLSTLINNLNLESRVFLKGRTNQPDKILETADIFILSSDFEGMPNSLMEAMAAGVPCISTDCSGGGARFLINNNINGLLIPVREEDKMADAIRTLLINSELKNKLGQEAKSSAEAFRPEKIYKQWNDYFNEVLKE